jgi:predicted nuclease of predicted toxin-antitoxin system
MRFLVDESTGPRVAEWLRLRGHDVYSIYEKDRGLDDDSIIAMAFEDERVLITNDKDFGDKVFHERLPHHGVVLLRLTNPREAVKVGAMRRLLDEHGETFQDRFVVVSETRIRFAALPDHD